MNNTDVMLSLFNNLLYEKKPPKKTYFLKLAKKADPATARGIIARVFNSKDSRQEFLESIRQMVTLDKIIAGLSADGFQGLVIHGQDVYPVKVTYESEDDRIWATENEDEISLSVAHSTMNTLAVNKIHCNVLMFKSHGFSGLMCDWPLERTAEEMAEESRLEGTNYFFVGAK